MFSKETFRYAKEISKVRETSDKPWLEMEPMEAVRALEPHLKRRLQKEFFLGEKDANKVVNQIKEKFKKLSTRLDAFLMLNAFIDVQLSEYDEARLKAEAEGVTVAELTKAEKGARAKKFFSGFRQTKRSR